jgi:RNA polymerase sigma-70 factor (ECF subfamily)
MRPVLSLRVPWKPGRTAESAGPRDADLVARVASGDREAEEALYRSHVRYIAGIVLRLLANPTEAEDVVQDTFTIALASLPSLRDPGALRPWLAQIAVSQVRRRFRRRRLLKLLGIGSDDDTGALETIAARDASPEVRSELYALGRALDTLPADQRIAWCLRYVEGDTLEEVARTCACSLATAKRRIATAHERVRAAVDVEDVALALRGTSLPTRPEVKA